MLSWLARIIPVLIAAMILSVSLCAIGQDTGALVQALPNKDKNSIDPIGDLAFKQLLHKQFPLTPSQIQQYKDTSAVQQKAMARQPGAAPPKAVSSTILVPLKPGAEQPVIRVARGYVSNFIFQDAAGRDWPIESYIIRCT